MSNLNPLDKPGEVFDLSLMNPNPTSSKTKDGPVYRVSFELEKDDWQLFMDANTKGMLIAAKACVAADGQSEILEKKTVRVFRDNKENKGNFGKNSQYLIQSGFFNIKQVMDAFGGDEAYQAWCRTQPCVISGDKDYSEKYPEGRCVYAHVRRADNSGTGIKPLYSGVPMKDLYHSAYQHQHGEIAAYEEYLVLNRRNDVVTLDTAKEWFNKQVQKHLQEWALSVLKHRLSIESMTFASPIAVRQWCQELGIEQYLPKGY